MARVEIINTNAPQTRAYAANQVCSNKLIWGEVSKPASRFYLKRVGGLHHWRMGRIGGSFYLAKKQPAARKRFSACEEWFFEASSVCLVGAILTNYFGS